MTSYEICRTCACHVKRADRSCPFCGAVMLARADARRPPARVSRAQWLAYGPTVALVAACTDGRATPVAGSPDATSTGVVIEAGTMATPMGDVAAPPVNQPDARGEAGDASTLEASVVEAAVLDAQVEADSVAPPVSVVFGDGGFACSISATYDAGTVVCDRSTQFCAPSDGVCQSFPQVCADAATGAGCQKVPYVQLKACDGGALGCDCVDDLWLCRYLGGDTYRSTCSDDGLGGVTIVCSMSACYGAPPARLERVAGQPVA